MIRPATTAAAAITLALGACAAPPPLGPTVMALPRQGQDFSHFQYQDNNCRNYAASNINYQQPSQAGMQSGVGSALLGTALGAGTGAVLGAVAGNAGAGAAIGGASGLLLGSAAGAHQAGATQAEFQYRYNMAYTQCMVAAGYTVQGSPY